MSKSQLQPSTHPFTFQIFDTIDEIFARKTFLSADPFLGSPKLQEIMGVELLLMDSTSNGVQGYIPANRLFRYEERLKSNSVYRLSNPTIPQSLGFTKLISEANSPDKIAYMSSSFGTLNNLMLHAIHCEARFWNRSVFLTVRLL